MADPRDPSTAGTVSGVDLDHRKAGTLTAVGSPNFDPSKQDGPAQQGSFTGKSPDPYSHGDQK
jgi:hypothetical protein